jgi:hypothetical protein
MIPLTLLYASFGLTFALATPSDIPTNIPPSFLTRSDDTFGTRSMWGITWSCLSTIFACAWIAVHPNIPGPKDSHWAVLCRRILIVVYILVAPEIVIAWAARQHFGARQLAKFYEGRGWTMTHGFFIDMGGFTLHDEQGTALRILEPDELMTLFPKGKIAWPSITEEEIQDRSKGDYLSKGIVLIQTTWFIAHCIARGVHGLEITQLEVVTLAFVALTGATSYLWWDKPADVRCSVPVYLIQHSNKVHVNSDSGSHSYINEGTQIRRRPLIKPDSTKPNSPERISTLSPEPNFTRMQQFSIFIQRQRQKYGSFLGLIYVFLIYPFYRFFQPLLDMLTSSTLRNSSRLRVPTFHAFQDARYAIIIAPPLAVIFGAIHCIAWSFHFPTAQEQLVWRLSAASVSAGPVLIFLLVWIFDIFGRQFGKSTAFQRKLGVVGMFAVFPLVVVLVVIYAAAKIALLVLPFTALRALPPAAFVDIRWTSFLPHLG